MFRIEEAIARAKASGKKNIKRELAEALWPEASYFSQNNNINNIANGSTKRINPDWVPIICTMCGVSADWLFGIN